MVQGIDSLEVYSDTQLDDSANSSVYDNMNADAINEELLLFCENVFEKYKLFKKKSLEENKNLFSKLKMVLQEKDEISIERDSLKSQLDLALNENKILKNKNDCDIVLKKNEALTSKLEII